MILRWSLLLLLAHAVLSEDSSTPNDPFHEISLLVQPQPAPPVCCLKPAPSSEPEEFLSFEEWKAKQLALNAGVKEKEQVVRAAPNHTGNTDSGPESSQDDPSDLPPSSQEAIITPLEPVSPHFRVPLTDRFNYANLDCSARVHTSHKSAKSPEAILSSKKDRYMLSPCASLQDNFVVVELCDDIRIDTVQLANFEFFSGVFKEFRVSVAKTYTTNSEEWTDAGTYRAKNVRGVQSFHPPTSLRDFYRFIRIDFLSYYGAEYYCPVSLLRVYGLTHLEHWKWDEWEAESRARRDEIEEREPVALAEPETQAQTQIPITPVEESPSSDPSATEDDSLTSAFLSTFSDFPSNHHGTDTCVSIEGSAKVRSSAQVRLSSDSTTPASNQGADNTANSHVSTISSTSSTSLYTASQTSDISTTPTPAIALIPSNSTNSSMSANSSSVSPMQYDTAAAAKSHVSSSLATSSKVATSVTTIVPMSSSTSSVVPSGESIFRTIINRLAMLETNTTLYTQYVEEQTRSVRETIRRLEEDVGRLEGIGKAQAQMFQRTLHDWQRQRERMEVEHADLMSRVSFLADEVVLEKRLGIAQLCLLLTVLVFMGLTRGSRGESFIDHTATAMHKIGEHRRGLVKEWSRRNLSLSSDWINRLRSRSSSRSQSPAPPAEHDKSNLRIDNKFAFPNASAPTTATNTTVRRKAAAPLPRVRTPSLRTPTSSRHFVHHRSATPTAPPATLLHTRPRSSGGRPQIQRSNSHGITTPGLVGPVPRSARKWARSAHLHEVRLANKDRGSEEENGVNIEVVNNASGSPSGSVSVYDVFEKDKGKGRESDWVSDSPTVTRRKPFSPLIIAQDQQLDQTRPRPSRFQSMDGDGESDVWLDTDADVSMSDTGQDVEYSPGDGWA